jgi:hypothetical protein
MIEWKFVVHKSEFEKKEFIDYKLFAACYVAMWVKANF